MQIPVYTQQTNVGGGLPAPRAEGLQQSATVGSALQNVGQALDQVSQAEKRLVQEQEEQDARTWAGQAASDAHLQWQTTLRERQEQATGGAQGFTPQMLTDFDKYSAEAVQNAPNPSAKRFLQQSLTSLRNQIGSQSITFEANARVADRVSTVSKTIDNWANVAYTDPSQAQAALNQIRETMPEVGPDMRAKLLNHAEQAIPYAAASGQLERAGKTGDLVGVRTMRTQLEGPEGERLDPTKRAALITKAYGFENGIIAAGDRAREKAERDALARENAATDSYNKAFDLWSQGRYFSQEFISQTSATVAGTASEGMFRNLVKSQNKVAGFASMSLPQQAAELERGRAAGSTPEMGVSPVEQQVQQQLERINQASIQAYRENPWKAAQERSVITDAPTVPIQDIPTAQRLIQQRVNQIGSVEIAADRRVSPLQPDEAVQLGKIIRGLPADQQASALATIGATIGDADRISDLAKQMGDRDKVLGTAMAFANARTTTGRYTAELVLRGEQALKDGTAKVDSAKETGWKAAIVKEIGDATQNTYVRDQWRDAAFNIQAALYAEGSGVDIRQAVNLATGGLRTQRDGTKVPLPYGMTDDTFTERINAIRAPDLSPQTRDNLVYVGGSAVPLDQFVSKLPQASLVHAGPGRYAVRAGTGLVTTTPGGKPLVIEVRQ